MSTEEENRKLVHRFYEKAFIDWNLDEAKSMLSENYTLHDPNAPDFEGGPEGWQILQEEYHQAFPDHLLIIEDQIAENDKVVTRWIACGTQRGDLAGIPATNKHIMVSGISITRVENGKIVEEWQNWDQVGMLRQLGALSEYEFVNE
jgi:steroid delta-isomerase-like uncharacterized protein